MTTYWKRDSLYRANELFISGYANMGKKALAPLISDFCVHIETFFDRDTKVTSISHRVNRPPCKSK